MDFYPSGIFLQTKSMSYSIILGEKKNRVNQEGQRDSARH